VEAGVLVVERLSALTDAFFASAQGPEVFGALGRLVRRQLEGHATGFLGANLKRGGPAQTVTHTYINNDAIYNYLCNQSVVKTAGANDIPRCRKTPSGWQSKRIGPESNGVRRRWIGERRKAY